ncbi:hypothetical protein CR513_61428, partial [Mucuna pruriens]
MNASNTLLVLLRMLCDTNSNKGSRLGATLLIFASTVSHVPLAGYPFGSTLGTPQLASLGPTSEINHDHQNSSIQSSPKYLIHNPSLLFEYDLKEKQERECAVTRNHHYFFNSNDQLVDMFMKSLKCYHFDYIYTKFDSYHIYVPT